MHEIGLSDFLNLIVIIFRTSFEPLPPKIIKYRNYKNFDEDKFRILFKKRLNDFNTDDITVDIFKMTFLNVLNRFVPLKKKYLRPNHSRMERSRLRNEYLKDLYENLDSQHITYNKKFWRTVKPLFSNKVRSNSYITLNENEKLMKN